MFPHFQLDYWWNAVRRIWQAKYWPDRMRRDLAEFYREYRWDEAS